MAWFQLSYDYQNQKRDLSDIFNVIVSKDPVLSSIISVGGIATNKKHERLEDSIAQVSWTLNAAYTSGALTMTVVDTTGMKVGDIYKFEDATTGATSTLKAKVATIPNATSFTFTVYGWSADQNVANASTIELVARPKNEGTDADPDNGTEQVVEYNYSQIFDRTAKVSKTTQFESKYGMVDPLNYQVEYQLKQIAYEVLNSMINGERVQRTATEAGTFGGILALLRDATWNKVAVGWAITLDAINDAFEVVNSNWWGNAVNTIVCHPFQARKISAFNTTWNNPVMTRSETTAGSYVMDIVWDTGNTVRILADRNRDKDKVAIIDPSKIKLVPFKGRAFSDEDATLNGSDYFARRILWEYTLEMKNASNWHVLLTWLTSI